MTLEPCIKFTIDIVFDIIAPMTTVIELIKQLQEARGSKIVCYITGDRRSIPANLPFSTQIHSDSFFSIYETIKEIQNKSEGKIKKLELFLYTRGGEIDAVAPTVNIFRKYSDKFNILVPFRAHSAGTLLCLGADNVIMTKIGEISPIDPTTANQFNPLSNPQDPNSPPKGISVEDVASYFKFALKGGKDNKDATDDKGRIVHLSGESSKLEVFKELTKNINPLAIGNVYRIYSQIRLLATNLLCKHMPKTDPRIKKIVNALVEEYFSHQHSLHVEDAIDIFGSQIVKKANDSDEKLMLQLLEGYIKALKIDEIFNLREFMGDDLEKTIDIDGAYIQSEYSTYIFKTKLKASQRTQLPPNVNIQAPPGNPIPLIPNLPRAMNIDLISSQWEKV